MDTGRDQFTPGPRRGAAGGLSAFELLGAVIFLAGCLPAAALAKAAARGTDLGAEGLGGAARLASTIAGWVGLWPGLAIGVVLAGVGAAMVVGSARRDPLRTVAGIVVSGMCVSAMASAVSLGAGGLVGDASGGAIAQGVGSWLGVLVGGAALLLSLWLSFAPERDRSVFGASNVKRRSPVAEAAGAVKERLAKRRERPTTEDESSVGNRGRRSRKIQAKPKRQSEPKTLGDALASGGTEGVSHDEAAALAPDDSTLAYMEDVWRRASESYTQADPVPPSPYPEDVRLSGGIPAGAAPFDPTAAKGPAGEAQAAPQPASDQAQQQPEPPSILPVAEVPAPRPASEIQFEVPTPDVAPFDFADELSAPIPLTEDPVAPAAGGDDPFGGAAAPVELDAEAAAAYGAIAPAPVERELPDGVAPLEATPSPTAAHDPLPVAPEASAASAEVAPAEMTSPPPPSWERAADEFEEDVLSEPVPLDPADIAEVDASGHWPRRDDAEGTEVASATDLAADSEEDELVELDLEDQLELPAVMAQEAAAAAEAPIEESVEGPAEEALEADPEPTFELRPVEVTAPEADLATDQVENVVEDELAEEPAAEADDALAAGLVTVEEALEEAAEEDDPPADELEAAEDEVEGLVEEDAELEDEASDEEEAEAEEVEEAELEEDEEYEYVDEDGNPIDPEDLAEMEVVDEDEEDSEEEAELEDGEESELEEAEEAELEEDEEYEYVDEDGNPVDPEDVDGEWEVFEEEDEEAELEESEAELEDSEESAFDEDDEEEGDEPESASDDVWEESDEWEEWDDEASEAAEATEDAVPEDETEAAEAAEDLDEDLGAAAEEGAPATVESSEEAPEEAPEAAPEAAETEPTKVLEPQAPPAGAETGRVLQAGRLVLGEGRVAVSLLQREMDLAFDEACGILDELQAHGLIGPYKGGKARDILLSADEWEALFAPSAPR